MNGIELLKELQQYSEEELNKPVVFYSADWSEFVGSIVIKDTPIYSDPIDYLLGTAEDFGISEKEAELAVDEGFLEICNANGVIALFAE